MAWGGKMKLRRVVLVIALAFLAGYLTAGCSNPKCIYENAITHVHFTAPCMNSPGVTGDYDHNNDDDDR
jgi:hypothetical protein